MLRGAGNSEEVRLCACRHHQVGPLQHTSVVERQGVGGEVDARDLRGYHLDRRLVLEDRPMGAGDVLSGQLGTGHLVEQWLELVVVVAIHQRHLDALIGQLAGAGHPREPATENQDPFSHVRRPPLAMQRTQPSTSSDVHVVPGVATPKGWIGLRARGATCEGMVGEGAGLSRRGP